MGTEMAEMNYMQRSKLNGYRAHANADRRNSLIVDAQLERKQHIELKTEIVSHHRQRLLSESDNADKDPIQAQLLNALDDETIEVLSEVPVQGEQVEYSLLVSYRATTTARPIAELITTLENCEVSIKHLETRALTASGNTLLVQCESTQIALLNVLKLCKLNHSFSNVEVHKTQKPLDVPWIPEHIWDLDNCGNTVTKYEPTLDSRHPGFGDKAYIARREQISAIGRAFKFGDSLPDIDYTAEEQATWHSVYVSLSTVHEQYACREFKQNIKRLEDIGLYTAHAIPQLTPVNKFLRRLFIESSGFSIRPCGGLLSARDFLASLAFRTFQATQYVRHASKPHHSPEPDVIHELIGHVPMLADPLFAEFSQEIGLASLGASDEDIEKLSTVYWFIIEFGLCREQGQLRAIGAGLLSAFGELQHAISNVPEQREFEPDLVAVQPYSDDDYQDVYYVAESIWGAMTKLREYAASISRPFKVLYDPYTQSVRTVRSVADCNVTFDRIQHDLAGLNTIITSLKTF